MLSSSIVSARAFRDIKKEYGSFSSYLWDWIKTEAVYGNGRVSSPLSDTISKDLKKRGMRFVSSLTIYTCLQAVGVICALQDGCFLEREGPIKRKNEGNLLGLHLA